MTHFDNQKGLFSYVDVDRFYRVSRVQVKVESAGSASTGYMFFRSGDILLNLCQQLMNISDVRSQLYLEDIINLYLQKNDCNVISMPIAGMPADTVDNFNHLLSFLEK
jgi:hypothetical protein